MKLIDSILSDIGDTSKCKKIRPFDVKELGYKFVKKIVIEHTGYIIYSLVDSCTNKPATFSFLYCKPVMLGIILPFPFEKYALFAISERRQKAHKTIKKKKEG